MPPLVQHVPVQHRAMRRSGVAVPVAIREADARFCRLAGEEDRDDALRSVRGIVVGAAAGTACWLVVALGVRAAWLWLGP